MPRKRKIHRQQSVCLREPCGLRHSPFAACADGFRKRIPFQRASSSTEPVAAPPSVEPEPAAVAAAAPNLALITDPEELAKYMPADLARELAERRQNDQIEKDWHAAEAATGMPLVRPARLRKKSAAAAAELLTQLDNVLGTAKTQAPRIPIATEAQVMHDTLVKIPQQRQDAETAAKEAAAPKPHFNGSTEWRCMDPSCGKRFVAASHEMVRRKARAEPEWTFVCPVCQSRKVMLAA